MGYIAGIAVVLLLIVVVFVAPYNPALTDNTAYYCIYPLILLAVTALLIRKRRR
jgi:hypothetical protein